MQSLLQLLILSPKSISSPPPSDSLKRTLQRTCRAFPSSTGGKNAPFHRAREKSGLEKAFVSTTPNRTPAVTPATSSRSTFASPAYPGTAGKEIGSRQSAVTSSSSPSLTRPFPYSAKTSLPLRGGEKRQNDFNQSSHSLPNTAGLPNPTALRCRGYGVHTERVSGGGWWG